MLQPNLEGMSLISQDIWSLSLKWFIPSISYINQGLQRFSSQSSLQRKNWPCRKKRERSFWCKDEKSWGFTKRYQWVKIKKDHARKVTRNFGKWFRYSHAESYWRFNKSPCLCHWSKNYNGGTQTEGCINRETDRQYKFPRKIT